MEFQESCEEVGPRVPDKTPPLRSWKANQCAFQWQCEEYWRHKRQASSSAMYFTSREIPPPARAVVESASMEVGDLERKGSHGRERSMPTTTLSLHSCTVVWRTLQQAFEEAWSLEAQNAVKQQCATSNLTTNATTSNHCDQACCQGSQQQGAHPKPDIHDRCEDHPRI
jgi:hypothetical protein